MTSSETVAELAAVFDAARAKVRELVADGKARNAALTAVGTAERRSVRALFAEPAK